MNIFSDIDVKPHAYGFSNGRDGVGFLPINPIEMSVSTDGEKWTSYYDLSEMAGIYLVDYDSSIVNPVENFNKISSMDGQNLTSSSYDSRDIVTNWYAWCSDNQDQRMAFHALQNLFMSRDGFWIAFGNEQSYKYRVKTKALVPTYTNEKEFSVQITFNNYTGLRESTVTSIEALEFLNEDWSIGMNIPHDDISFESNEDSFKIYNPSDIDIDPLQQKHYFKIIISGVGSPTITNKTTGDSFTYNRVLRDGDVLVLDGVDPIYNGSPDGIHSDHGYITLKTGNNNFSISGLSNIDIKFVFYFIYF